MVESALVTPLLMIFLFGIFEFGFAFRDYLGVANSTRDGVRAASVAGDDLDADFRALSSIRRAGAALPDGTIQRIVIYKASGPDADPSATCAAGTSVVNECNAYLASDLNRPVDQFGCASSTIAPFAPDRFWCPSARQTSAGSGLDYVGVYMVVQHDYVTGLFGNAITFDDQIVLKVEPQSQ